MQFSRIVWIAELCFGELCSANCTVRLCHRGLWRCTSEDDFETGRFGSLRLSDDALWRRASEEVDLKMDFIIHLKMLYTCFVHFLLHVLY